MPYRTPPGQPRDLQALIEMEMRERIREAADHVSLDVMVRRRQRGGLPAPSPDSATDREEFEAGVAAFLQHLVGALTASLPVEDRRRVDEAASRAGEERTTRLVAAHVVLARTLPDYWQRFDAVRQAYRGEEHASGGDRRGLLGRLFGR
jgi:hypothetical protein